MSALSYKKLLIKHPWYESWKSAKRRCTDPRHKSFSRYGGRGILFKLTKEEVEILWYRDQAILMVRPRLDRINVDDHYCFENCRFIPELENLSRRYKIQEVCTEWTD